MGQNIHFYLTLNLPAVVARGPPAQFLQPWPKLSSRCPMSMTHVERVRSPPARVAFLPGCYSKFEPWVCWHIASLKLCNGRSAR